VAGETEQLIADSFERLLHALRLAAVGTDRFAVRPEPGRFAQVFGGQMLAQALLAAAATVEGKAPQSLHGYFVDAGRPEHDLAVDVRRLRDGRSMSLRGVDVNQGGRTVVTALASFHDLPFEPQLADPPPSVAAAEEMPTLRHWAAQAPPELAPLAQVWIDSPPPIEMRLPEAPTFFGGPPASGARSHWMRLPRAVDDPTLSAALLAYASDYFLLDMAFRSHAEPYAPGTIALSLDHAIWFHRPVRFDGWHLHTMETVTLNGERGLVRGVIHDDAGAHVATVAQEVLVRWRGGGG